MGIRAGYRVEKGGAFGRVLDVRTVAGGDEPCFATVEWPDGRRHELLRDLTSAPPVARLSDPKLPLKPAHP